MTIEIQDTSVFKGGQRIGYIEGGRCVLYKRPAPPLYKAINEAHGSKLSFDIAPENEPKAKKPKASQEPPDLGAPIEAPAPTAAKIIEPLHLQTAAMGDKTPAFVQWCRENLPPAEFERRYKNRRIPEDMRAYEDGEKSRHGRLKDEVEDSAD